jgi:hypothetical protein
MEKRIKRRSEANQYLNIGRKISSLRKVLRLGWRVGVAGKALLTSLRITTSAYYTGYHGRSGGRVILGSVADYVVRHTGVPVLLVRARK